MDTDAVAETVGLLLSSVYMTVLNGATEALMPVPLLLVMEGLAASAMPRVPLAFARPAPPTEIS